MDLHAEFYPYHHDRKCVSCAMIQSLIDMGWEGAGVQETVSLLIDPR